jgi:SAM-dependent methyltransferase
MDIIARRTAALYDLAVADWPGEIEFYRALAAGSAGGLLEVGCGTGRVTLRLEGLASPLVGLDLSAAMLEVARVKSQSIRWVEGDMRGFDLGAAFGLILIPGHSFQHMQTADDQRSCLECMFRHLTPGGTLVIHLDHQDLRWLAGLPSAGASNFKPAPDILDPKSGHRFAVCKAWAYEPSSQTATVVSEYQELDERGERLGFWRTEPLRLHCVFRHEMEHALRRAGFEALEVFGDFGRGPLQDDSREMLWLARRPAEGSRPAGPLNRTI